MAWSLYEKGRFLKPLVFSNNKTQEDVVNEVLSEIKKGEKIIFIKGICGTGKSAIALNLAKKLGKTSIIVPGKNLQAQYKKDYEKNKYVLKKNKEKLKISVITGRNNHPCKFLQDKKNSIPKITREINSKLYDIFDRKEEEKKKILKDESADNFFIPCKIEIKEKNWNKLKNYLRENKYIDYTQLNDIKNVKRVSVASICPYWSPVFPSKYEFKGPIFSKAKKHMYYGLEKNEFIFYERKEGCKFYEQFHSFIESDVIIFNALKYKLESAMNRKPFTEVEIIDECDDFLDSFANQKNINLDRLQNSLIHFIGKSESTEKEITELLEIIKHIKKDQTISDALFAKEIIPLKKTGVYDLLKIISSSISIFEEADDESYLFEINEIARTFEGFMNETYLTLEKRDKNLIVNLVTINLAKKLKEIIEKNKTLVLMSGTLHSKEVLKNIFGLDKFKFIEAEIQQQGNIKIRKTSLEKDFKYSNFSNGNFSRQDYLLALNKCVEIAKRPCLVHVNAFKDLPDKEELKEYNLKNLISREELKEIQLNDLEGEIVSRFKSGNIDVLFSTRVSRGIDFPGEECNSILFTKYPNPNVQDAFWKILYRTKPYHYWAFYKDKARRELWQKVYRGLRFKEDKVEVLSPDLRVLDAFENNTQTNIL